MNREEYEGAMVLSAFYEGEEEERLKDSDKNKVYSARDSALRSKDRFGRANMTWMVNDSGLSKEKLFEELHGTALWLDPVQFDRTGDKYSHLLFGEEYFRGNIFKLLEQAEDMNEKYSGLFQNHVDALKNMMPEDMDSSDIYFSLGDAWIPTLYYEWFIIQLLRLRKPPEVKQSKVNGKYTITLTDKKAKKNVLNTSTYGTEHMSAVKIIEKIMNAEVLRVTRTDGNNKTVLLRAETELVLEKAGKIKEAFKNWIHADEVREDRLREIYLKRHAFAGYKYDGSYLELPGLNPDLQLYQHQRDAICRLIFNKNVLIAHDAGSGKTDVMAVGGHELKRLGISTKNLYIVPKNVLIQSSARHKFDYPNDKILVIEPKDFVPVNRRKVLEKIRDEDWDGIYISYASFENIPLSKRYLLDKQSAEIRKWEARLLKEKDAKERSAIKKLLKKLKDQSFDLLMTYSPDEDIAFDKLGITGLIVDEAHNYKNLTVAGGKFYEIVGFRTKGSKKCDKMLERVRYIQEKNGNVIFATGTPLTNSLADIYIYQRYLQPEILDFCNLKDFGNWLNAFSEREVTFEVDVDAQNMVLRNRFSRFHNLPELMNMFASSACDFYQGNMEDLDNFPEGVYEDVVVKRSPEQKEYFKELAKETEDIRNGDSDGCLLDICQRGRKAALDIRLVKPDVTENLQYCKIMRCAEKIFEKYKEYPGTAQMVFCDSSTPKTGFNAYDELKRLLILKGIKENEIAFIHDATTEKKRTEILEKTNRGSIRVLVGSTQKLGYGTNAQAELIAMYHLDIPWRPCDIAQREARILRQGNNNKKVFIYRFVLEGSFDAYTYQLLQNKQSFISSFMKGTLSGAKRSEQDISDLVLTYGEIKALAIGNPRIKDRVEKANKLEYLKIAQSQRRKQLRNLHNLIMEIPGQIYETEKQLKQVDEDYEYYSRHKKTVPISEREAFGKELLEALENNVMEEDMQVFDWYQEFVVKLPAKMTKEQPYVIVTRYQGGIYKVDMTDATALGCSKRLDALFEQLQRRKDRCLLNIQNLEADYREAERQLAAGNEYDSKVAAAKRELDQIDAELLRM